MLNMPEFDQNDLKSMHNYKATTETVPTKEFQAQKVGSSSRFELKDILSFKNSCKK